MTTGSVDSPMAAATPFGAASEDKRLDHLLTYTTFHIGVYVSATAAAIGASTFATQPDAPLRHAAALFLLAGVCGGVIASNIPDHRTMVSYAERRIGFWGIKLARWQHWARLEHILFWAGVIRLVVPFLIWGELR